MEMLCCISIDENTLNTYNSLLQCVTFPFLMVGPERIKQILSIQATAIVEFTCQAGQGKTEDTFFFHFL